MQPLDCKLQHFDNPDARPFWNAILELAKDVSCANVVMNELHELARDRALFRGGDDVLVLRWDELSCLDVVAAREVAKTVAAVRADAEATHPAPKALGPKPDGSVAGPAPTKRIGLQEDRRVRDEKVKAFPQAACPGYKGCAWNRGPLHAHDRAFCYRLKGREAPRDGHTLARSRAEIG